MQAKESQGSSSIVKLRRRVGYAGLVLTAAAGFGLIGHSIVAEQDAESDYTSAPQRAAAIIDMQEPTVPNPTPPELHSSYQNTLGNLEVDALNALDRALFERLIGVGILTVETMGVVAAVATRKEPPATGQKPTHDLPQASTIVRLPRKVSLFDSPFSGS